MTEQLTPRPSVYWLASLNISRLLMLHALTLSVCHGVFSFCLVLLFFFLLQSWVLAESSEEVAHDERC